MENELNLKNVFYQKGESLTLEKAKIKAINFYKYIIGNSQNIFYELDDYWYGIAENWDLNIFKEDKDDEKHILTLYPVTKKGGTNYNIFYRVGEF